MVELLHRCDVSLSVTGIKCLSWAAVSSIKYSAPSCSASKVNWAAATCCWRADGELIVSGLTSSENDVVAVLSAKM